MQVQKKKQARRTRIKRRIRGKVNGTAYRPRLNVYRSNTEIYAQLIDDTTGTTLLSANSLKKEEGLFEGKSKTEIAGEVGKMIAQKALDANITQVSFDRNGFLYHGRVKALAEGARQAGLIF